MVKLKKLVITLVILLAVLLTACGHSAEVELLETSTSFPAISEVSFVPEPHYPIGAGTAADPWQLAAPEHLLWINSAQERLGGHFVLMNDIAAPENFMIGSPASRFSGIFDGGHNTITVEIYYPEMTSAGFFRFIDFNGVVRNLNVTGNVYANNRVGALAGTNSGKVIGSSSKAYVSGRSSVGGLVGWNNSYILNCSASGYTTGNNAIGGMVGMNLGEISNSFASGNVSGEGSVGGLIGESSGLLFDSYAKGDVSGSGTAVGGLVGAHGFNGWMWHSYATGNVSGKNRVGGLAGGVAERLTVRYSVALNANISSEDIVGRVWVHGSIRGGAANNFASSGVLVNGQPFMEDSQLYNQQGQTVAAHEVATEAFWRETIGLDLDDIWEWNEDLGLPILRDVPGIQNPSLLLEPPSQPTIAAELAIVRIADDLYARINELRAEASQPLLVRDKGLDLIASEYATQIFFDTDARNGDFQSLPNGDRVISLAHMLDVAVTGFDYSVFLGFSIEAMEDTNEFISKAIYGDFARVGIVWVGERDGLSSMVIIVYDNATGRQN